MTQMIFVNLPVADVDRSASFYEAVGCTKDPRFSQPGASAAMRLSDAITFMLLSHARFADFAPHPMADPRATSQVLLTLSRDSRAEVDSIVERAVAAGGRADLGGKEETGDYMYSRDFEDLDGHGFGIMWMDMAAAMHAWGQAPADAPAA